MTDERRGHAPTPHESDNPLDREIRRLLAVDPSPAFEARVRARVAADPTRNAWRAGRLWMGFGAAAAALVLAVAVFRPGPPADTGGEPALGIARTGDIAPPSSGAESRPRGDGAAAERSPSAVTEPTAVPEPALSGPPATPVRVAAGPPRATPAPPGPPRFTRVVLSESERGALRQLLARARNQPVFVPVPAEAHTSVAADEPPAGLDIPPTAIQPPAGLEIPPIAIEPLNLALLDTGAVE